MAQRSLAKKDRDAPARGIELSPAERVEAWLLTGPAGRVWSFGRDVASAGPMLARYWGARAAGRLRKR
jgi:hypothetical protein